jgi:hypothetical protein
MRGMAPAFPKSRNSWLELNDCSQVVWQRGYAPL